MALIISSASIHFESKEKCKSILKTSPARVDDCVVISQWQKQDEKKRKKNSRQDMYYDTVDFLLHSS